MGKPRKLLTIGHSYVVALNRRLADEMARLGGRDWEVTAVAPTYFHGGRDLRPVAFQSPDGERCRVVAVAAYLTRFVHVFFYGWSLRRLLAQPWDLIHCWEEPYIVAGRQIAGWTPGSARLVFASFQNQVKHYPPPFSWMERFCLRRAAGWIAFGHTVADALGTRPGYRDRPTRIITPGVDLDRFHPEKAAASAVFRELGWDENGPPVVGYLGRFVPEKGIELLQRVLDRLKTPWRALFVGAGPMEGELRRWAAGHGDRVRLCTAVQHAAVPAYLNAMNMLCAPSQTTTRWREQFGRMLIEAFACGVPVIGSSSGEIPHVIGDAGLVVGEHDEAGWASAIAELLESPDRRRDLGRRGLEQAQARYAWSVVARQHLAFFEEILAQSQR